MMKMIFYGILIYMLYKLIFDFIIPVSKATRQIKRNIKNAQSHQRFQQQQQQYTAPKEPFQKQNSGQADTEYIDYEEVK